MGDHEGTVSGREGHEEEGFRVRPFSLETVAKQKHMSASDPTPLLSSAKSPGYEWETLDYPNLEAGTAR